MAAVAVSVSSSQTETKSKNKAKAKPTTKKSLGVRFIRGRLYDSQNGKSCHQVQYFTFSHSSPKPNKEISFLCLLFYFLDLILM